MTTSIFIGLCGNKLPKSVFPTIQNGVSPVVRGLIKNWDSMEQLWHRVFYNELEIKPEEHPLLYIESILNTIKDREKMGQIMFENYKIPSLFVLPSTFLTVLGNGLECGICIESGDGITQFSVIADCVTYRPNDMTYNFAGSDLTENFINRMNDKGYNLNTPEMKNAAKNIKETLFYTVLDVNDEIKKDVKELERSYKLPDGKEMIVGRERYGFPEALFNPSVIGLTQEGIHEFVCNCIGKMDDGLKAEVGPNIVLRSGNTMFPGFKERLAKEMNIIDSKLMPKFHVHDDPKLDAWIGGSFFAETMNLVDISVTKEDYNERGPDCITQKFYFRH
ncbi:actin-1, putative [Entamoeba invadens IP1]|uniref:Actin-1, putative n=1 Tax=Entamoeba invadens IP1 TaxID=370355 RepID=L7FNC1_ENTIV|nr:actin-1, putative [Entamoeba invadens IP1]ELP91793.1 actin-1, putative [Entamoeba invadens IP1]|eukprot:XP_004258564.1 actin-1, putative [Entamoeba invadens IP1]